MKYYSAIKKNKIMPFAATWMELETLILSEVRKRKTNTIWYHLYLESNIRHKWIFPQKRKSWTWSIDLWLPRGEVGWLGSLGLVDTNYCLWNRLAMRSCCVALGTMCSHLWWSMIMCGKRMYTCMWCVTVSPCCTVEYWQNTVNQL